MPVTVRLPGALRDATGGETKLIASEGTLREVIAEIDRRHPGFASRVLSTAAFNRSNDNWPSATHPGHDRQLLQSPGDLDPVLRRFHAVTLEKVAWQ